MRCKRLAAVLPRRTTHHIDLDARPCGADVATCTWHLSFVSAPSSREASRLPSLPMKVALLSTLYASQGLPYGFFTQALPVLLREQKATLTAIGLTSLLAFPWAMKALWAPLIDRFPRVRGGRRRAAVLALQGSAIVSVLLLSLFDPERVLLVLIVGVVVTKPHRGDARHRDRRARDRDPDAERTGHRQRRAGRRVSARG
jgi:hypothetical protein